MGFNKTTVFIKNSKRVDGETLEKIVIKTSNNNLTSIGFSGKAKFLWGKAEEQGKVKKQM